MPLDERDAGCVWDMLEAARTINDFVNGVTLQQYLADRKLQLAVERLIEIVGEAARGVSSECKSRHTEIPWRGIVAQRHVLAHEYGDIKQDRIWAVATERVPERIGLLEPLLPRE